MKRESAVPDWPLYTEVDQGLDQDRDARKATSVRHQAYRQQTTDTRRRVVDVVRGGLSSDDQPAALAALERQPGRPAQVSDANDAVLYARVSTRDQARTGGGEEGYSIPYQREACRAKAEQLGAIVVDEYVDAGESAKSADRPELQRLLREIKKRRVRYLIVHKIDRLARNREDDMAIRLSLARAGVELVSCTENLTNNAHGRFMHNIMADMAEFYRDNLGEEVMKGLTRKAREGGTPFRAPLGYLNTHDLVEGVTVSRVVLDPERAPLVRWCLSEYATGQWVVSDLVLAAWDRGLTTKPTRVRPARPISLSTMHNILRNPYYMGIVAYNGGYYEGKHPALVEPETWLRVQDNLTAHNHAGEKDRKHPHYLRGSIFCGGCGGRLVYSRNRGNGGLYEYFFCVKKKTKQNNCPRGGIRLATIEDGIARFYELFQPSPERLRWLRDGVLDEFAAHIAEARQRTERARKRHQAVLDERTKLMQAHYAGAVPVDLLKTEMERLTRAASAAEREIQTALVSLDKIEQTLNRALAIAGRCHQEYVAAEPAIRRQINQGFFEKIYVAQDGSIERYDLTEPFAALLGHDLAGELAIHDQLGDMDPATAGEQHATGCDVVAAARPTSPAAVLSRISDLENNTTLDIDLVQRGVNKPYVVGDTGFEPVTSSVSKASLGSMHASLPISAMVKCRSEHMLGDAQCRVQPESHTASTDK